MPVIKLWCLPKSNEEKLQEVFDNVVYAVTSVKELGLKSQRDMTVLFPPDMMAFGLGTSIIIEVTGLFEKPERTSEVLSRLAENLGKAVKAQFSGAYVECFIYPFDPSQGFWSSPSMGLRHKPTKEELRKLLSGSK